MMNKVTKTTPSVPSADIRNDEPVGTAASKLLSNRSIFTLYSVIMLLPQINAYTAFKPTDNAMNINPIIQLNL